MTEDVILCTVPVDLSSSVSCVKLYAQQHFTSCFIVYFSFTPVLVITESISASIFCSLPFNPESRIHHNFSRQISDDDVLSCFVHQLITLEC
ncbi:hypothetical protein T09_11734 [Trichinella sp. T9]|nr:hypothetical protein T09_11734 [Trichinella sp. T9]